MSARLNALKMQLQPHFLFNTLNAITVLVRQQKGKDAEQMLGHLSDLLRGVLEDVDVQEVSLRRELEYLQLYLAIEQVRFPDRLRVEVSADPATQEASVPQLILQPIVENAIRHGIGRSSSAGRILISASKINGTVELFAASRDCSLESEGSIILDSKFARPMPLSSDERLSPDSAGHDDALGRSRFQGESSKRC
jgi:LytS/YehU family sensor histidine kinase